LLEERRACDGCVPAWGDELYEKEGLRGKVEEDGFEEFGGGEDAVAW
jgi:hypothetical protein